jgi:queuosine precursor transporter
VSRAIIVLAVAYVSTVVLANWLTSSFGLVAAGFALLVPAGTYAAGLALGLRDCLQDAAGVRWVLAAIAVGTAVSFVVADPFIAAASGVAFLSAELADLAVYTPLRRRGWRRALVASNAVGSVVDTLLFLWIAGFPVTGQSVGGQVLVKAVWCTAAVLAVREVARRVPRQRQLAEGA